MTVASFCGGIYPFFVTNHIHADRIFFRYTIHATKKLSVAESKPDVG